MLPGPLRRLCSGQVRPKSHHVLHLPRQVAVMGYAANSFCGGRKRHWLKTQAELEHRGYEKTLASQMVSTCLSDCGLAGPGADSTSPVGGPGRER